MRRKGERSSEGGEQEKASDGEGTSASTDERKVSSETAEKQKQNRSENWFGSRQTRIFAPLSVATRVMTT